MFYKQAKFEQCQNFHKWGKISYSVLNLDTQLDSSAQYTTIFTLNEKYLQWECI